MTPDHIFPGPGALLAHKLGLDGRPALDIRQQCAAMIFALQIIDGLFKADVAQDDPLRRRRGARGLHAVDGLEPPRAGLHARHASDEEKSRCDEHRALAVLFGDGAGAMIFRKTDRDAGLVKAEGPHRRRAAATSST